MGDACDLIEGRWPIDMKSAGPYQGQARNNIKDCSSSPSASYARHPPRVEVVAKPINAHPAKVLMPFVVFMVILILKLVSRTHLMRTEPAAHESERTNVQSCLG